MQKLWSEYTAERGLIISVSHCLHWESSYISVFDFMSLFWKLFKDKTLHLCMKCEQHIPSLLVLDPTLADISKQHMYHHCVACHQQLEVMVWTKTEGTPDRVWMNKNRSSISKKGTNLQAKQYEFSFLRLVLFCWITVVSENNWMTGRYYWMIFYLSFFPTNKNSKWSAIEYSLIWSNCVT